MPEASMFIQSQLLDSYVFHGFTTRAMGDMSLARNTDGKAEQNNRAFFDFLGIDQQKTAVINPQLNHGANVAFIERNGKTGHRPINLKSPEVKLSQRICTIATEDLSAEDNLGIDACFTTDPGVMLAMCPADCAIIYVFDTFNHEFGLIHAGTACIISAGVYQILDWYLQESHAVADAVLAFVSPSISAQAYTLTKSGFWDSKLHRIMSREDARAYDPKQAILEQMLSAGLKRENISFSPFCTASNPDLFFSNHASQNPDKEGRMLAFIAKYSVLQSQ